MPFKLFLLAYAILGPLHYLTEINWLNKKNFFVGGNRSWYWVFVIGTLLFCFYPVFSFFEWMKEGSVLNLFEWFTDHVNHIVLAALLFASSLLFMKKPLAIALSVVISIAIAFLMEDVLNETFIYLALFLPTIIHVYLFTLLFVLYGAVKSKSKYGFYTALMMFLVPVFIVFIPIDTGGLKPDSDTFSAYTSSGMDYVGLYLAKLMGFFEGNSFDQFSTAGIKIQIFIAFSYTYHYLNWFSKTSIIGWKESLNLRSGLLILSIWLGAVALYHWNYETGLIALLFLSYLHVFLEFPLNWITIKELVKFRKS